MAHFLLKNEDAIGKKTISCDIISYRLDIERCRQCDQKKLAKFL